MKILDNEREELTYNLQELLLGGSGCGSVGKAVASDTRGPRFESRHRQSFY